MLEAFMRQAIREEVRAAVQDVVRELGERRRPEPSSSGIRVRPLLTTKQAAAIVGVAEKTIRAWVGQGKLKRYNAGRELRVAKSDLERFVETGAVNAEHDALEPDQLAARLLEGVGS
jgi:excisionase family DNA binding protein